MLLLKFLLSFWGFRYEVNDLGVLPSPTIINKWVSVQQLPHSFPGAINLPVPTQIEPKVTEIFTDSVRFWGFFCFVFLNRLILWSYEDILKFFYHCFTP